MSDILKAVRKPDTKEDLLGEKNKLHILVVDDDIFHLRIAEKILGGNYGVTCISSGKSVFEFLKTAIPDIILLDLCMPEMDGFQVMEKLKTDERYKNIPIIFLSGDNDEESREKGIKMGAVDFILKPFKADILLEKIRRLV